MQILLFLLPAVAFAAHPAPYGYEHPKLYCRDTNTSVYAEVCVPQFTDKVTPIPLAVKVVAPDQFCYESVLTVCEETNSINTHTLCTSSYESVKADLKGQVTQVTYEDKSETMKVTTCRASGYGSEHHYGGEHQYCREEYQTQAYKVPLVTAPLEVDVQLAAPQPVETCQDVDVTITEVKCNDIKEQKCVDLVKFDDATVTINQVDTIISDVPDCEKVTLTLPTKACSKPY